MSLLLDLVLPSASNSSKKELVGTPKVEMDGVEKKNDQIFLVAAIQGTHGRHKEIKHIEKKEGNESTQII